MKLLDECDQHWFLVSIQGWYLLLGDFDKRLDAVSEALKGNVVERAHIDGALQRHDGFDGLMNSNELHLVSRLQDLGASLIPCVLGHCEAGGGGRWVVLTGCWLGVDETEVIDVEVVECS